MSGWIKLHREIRGSKIWECEPFDRFKAWIDLLLLAQYKSGSFFKRHIEVFYQRGDVTHSIRGLAARWDWSRTRVESFLDDLVADGRIEIKKATVTTLISICNYELYQDEEPQESHRKATGKPQESPYKESKEGKETTTTTRAKKIPPNRNEVIAFFLDHGYGQDDAEEFFDYWEGEDWIRAGNQPIRSWQATARNRFKALKEFEANDNATTKGKHRSHSDAIENW